MIYELQSGARVPPPQHGPVREPAAAGLATAHGLARTVQSRGLATPALRTTLLLLPRNVRSVKILIMFLYIEFIIVSKHFRYYFQCKINLSNLKLFFFSTPCLYKTTIRE